MFKEKISVYERMRHWFTYHPWLKTISLILAILVWFYVKCEINRFNY